MLTMSLLHLTYSALPDATLIGRMPPKGRPYYSRAKGKDGEHAKPKAHGGTSSNASSEQPSDAGSAAGKRERESHSRRPSRMEVQMSDLIAQVSYMLLLLLLGLRASASSSSHLCSSPLCFSPLLTSHSLLTSDSLLTSHLCSVLSVRDTAGTAGTAAEGKSCCTWL